MNPVYLPRATWPTRSGGDDDTGLRELLRSPDVRWVDGDGIAPIDVDVPADLAALAALLRS